MKSEEDALKLRNEYVQAALSERTWGHSEVVFNHDEQEEIKDQTSKPSPKPLSQVPITSRADSKPANVSQTTRASKNYNYQYELQENKG